jgi:ABC-type uncharacterized transport system substrate-binding protein
MAFGVREFVMLESPTATRRVDCHSRRRLLQDALALVISSFVSGCEKPAKAPRIGFVAVGSREGRALFIEGLLQGLRELGYVEGQNIVIAYRFSEDRYDRLPVLAAELVALKVDVIVASGSPASFAAKEATTTIPIVMGSLSADPVASGLIANLARPGGNITGMSGMSRSSTSGRCSCSGTPCRPLRGWPSSGTGSIRPTTRSSRTSTARLK